MAEERQSNPNEGLSAALEAATLAAKSLAAATARLQANHGPTSSIGADPGNYASMSNPDDEARRFHERLEQAGQLVDVDENTDLTNLPPRVTHIRRPDGTIERIGFSNSI